MQTRPWLEWTVLALCAAFVVWLWIPARHNRQISCISNLKQLSLGAIVYSADYDDRLMDRDRWLDQIQPFVKNEIIARCPKVVGESEENFSLYGYAFNSRLHVKDSKSIALPEEKPLLYDSINLARNASDPFSSLPDPPRHRDLMNVACFLDGHALGLTKEKAKSVRP